MNVKKMTLSALLVAIGILIPLVSPAKIVVPPASFTLASHVPIFLAMMLSPSMSVTVALGTTLGFFFSTPLIIALRAATHVVFAFVGGHYLQKRPSALDSLSKIFIFSLLIGVLHAICEVAVVSWFYMGGNVTSLFYEQGFFQSVILAVGAGSVIHSMVDFEIALVVFKALPNPLEG